MNPEHMKAHLLRQGRLHWRPTAGCKLVVTKHIHLQMSYLMQPVALDISAHLGALLKTFINNHCRTLYHASLIQAQ